MSSTVIMSDRENLSNSAAETNAAQAMTVTEISDNLAALYLDIAICAR